MSLTITLLGTAGAQWDARPVVGIRGRKAWALLAYLLLAGAPVSRERLATMFFPDAGDPAGVLRWNLSQLRRNLGIEIAGDPVRVALPEDTVVDVQLLHQDTERAVTLAHLGEDLLAGSWPEESAPFEVWLESERRHLRALSADVLREAALQRLARGHHDTAVDLAERVVALEPLDENASVLLIRALRLAGRTEEARSVADSTAARLRRELGVDPSPALQAALHATQRPAPAVDGHRPSRRAAVAANREAGVAAVAAGAPEAGIGLLREALGGARALDEPDLLARTLTDLGGALIHAVRGTDQDAVGLLHEAVCLIEHADDPQLMATAMRELGYVEMLRGRYPRAELWFRRAAGAAGDDLAERAWIATYAGAAQSDVADYPRAVTSLQDAVDSADEAGLVSVQALARAMRGRLRLMTGDLDAATVDLDAALELGARHGLRTLVPWPASLRAEVDLVAGRATAALERLEHAYATSRQIDDPCWGAMALRGLGIAHVRGGDVSRGVELLEGAPTECRRLPDTYRWVEAYALDALAALGIERDLAQAGTWAWALEELATAHGMRELSCNAAGYRAALREPGAEELLAARREALTVSTAVD